MIVLSVRAVEGSRKLSLVCVRGQGRFWCDDFFLIVRCKDLMLGGMTRRGCWNRMIPIPLRKMNMMAIPVRRRPREHIHGRSCRCRRYISVIAVVIQARVRWHRVIEASQVEGVEWFLDDGHRMGPDAGSSPPTFARQFVVIAPDGEEECYHNDNGAETYQNDTV